MMKTSVTQQPRARLLRGTRTYFAIDGGAGANMLADLAGRDPYLQAVASPRHADLLIIVGPVSNKLVPSLVAIAKSLPHPARVLLMHSSDMALDTSTGTDVASLKAIFPEAEHVSSLDQFLTTAFDTPIDKHAIIHITEDRDKEQKEQKEQEPTTIQLPQKSEQEMATELVVLSLGPVQPFTAGPLRLFLVCDGEQVLSVQVEAGYAHRGIDGAMKQATWQQGLMLTRHFDPLAPFAGQLAYVQAVEQLQGWQPSQAMTTYRDVVIALERVQNTLWWCVRLAHTLADEPMLSRSTALAHALSTRSTHLWQRSPKEWLAPQCEGTVLAEKASLPQHILHEMDTLLAYVTRNRLLALRTRNIGVLDASEPGIQGTQGTQGIQDGKSDVQSRLVTRLQAAQRDMQDVAEMLNASPKVATAHEANWTVLAGEAHSMVRGPRGNIGLHLMNEGGEGPTHVVWQRPSAALLPLLPEMLEGQKLTDAELIVASLDLSMAEVDG